MFLHALCLVYPEKITYRTIQKTDQGPSEEKVMRSNDALFHEKGYDTKKSFFSKNAITWFMHWTAVFVNKIHTF